LLAVSFLFGSEILSFLGITLMANQITDGLIVASTGWSLINQQVAASSGEDDSDTLEDALQYAFYPLTLPITVGRAASSSQSHLARI